jgi:hypothetical protein
MATLDTLTTRMEADIQKFEESMKRMQSVSKAAADKVLADNTKAANDVSKVWEKAKIGPAMQPGAGGGGFKMPSLNMGKANPGEALDAVVGKIKSGALEEGASQLGVFGAALEALGPYGVAAGAGLAALAIGAESAIKSAEWAEELERTSKILGVTTDDLQKFDLIAQASGIPVDKMRESLKGLNQVIGNVEDGAAKTRTLKLFDQMGLDKDTLESLGSVSNILPKIIDQVSELNAPQRASVSKLLKIDPDVMQSLVDSKDNISDLMDKMTAYGLVVNKVQIQQAAEANQKMNEAQAIMNGELKKAFITLAPTIASIEIFFAKCTNSLANFIIKCEDAIRPIMDVVHAIMAIPGVTNGIKAGVSAMIDATPGARSVIDGFNNLAAKGKQEREASEAAWAKAHPEKPEAAGGAPHLNLGTTPKAKKAPEDETASFDSAVSGMADAADKAADQAKLALAKNLDERAAIERDIAAKELASEINRLEEEKNKINKASKEGKDHNAPAEIAAINEIEATDKHTQALKDELAARTLAIAKIQQEAELHQQSIAAQEAAISRTETYYQGMATLSTTLADRQSWERKALQAAQTREDLAAQGAVDAAKAQVDQATSAEALAKAQAALAAALDAQKGLGAQHAQQTAIQGQSQFNATPGGQLISGLNDVNTQLQAVKAKGLDGLTDGLTAAIMHTKSLGQAFHEVSTQIITDLVKIGVQQLVEKPLANMLFGGGQQSPMGGSSGGGGFLGGLFGGGGNKPDGTQNNPIYVTMGGAGGAAGLLGGAGGAGGAGGILGTIMSFLPHFAGGTDDAQGGPALVGEDGPEIVNLNKGDSVLTSPKTMQAMGASPQGGGGTSSNEVHFHNNVYANDALLEGNIRQMIAQGNMMTYNAVKNTIPTDQSRAQRQRLW